MKRCDIIMPVWNQLEVTRDCIASIAKNTDYPYRLIIIDNGSDKETEDYLKSLAGLYGFDLTLIRNNKNLGFVKAVNQGIKASTAPYLCIMNNDTIATSGWLAEMVTIIESNSYIGLINPSSNTSGQFPSKSESIDEYALTLKRFAGEIQELYTCRGFCMLLKKEIIDNVGLLDEVYHMGYFDDTDYCKRAQKMGYGTARAKAAYVYHKENTSFKKLKDNKTLFKDNEKIFFNRWGRPVRIGYFIDRIRDGDKINDLAKDVARSGHQIMIFLKKGLSWPVTLDHFDIRKIDVNPLFFGIISIYKIIRRKNKKKLDIVIADDRILGYFLKMIKEIHRADILINPRRDKLMQSLEQKSKEF